MTSRRPLTTLAGAPLGPAAFGAMQCGAGADAAASRAMLARIEELEATNDVLGKAIGLLHKLSEHEPDTPPMSEPTSS